MRSYSAVAFALMVPEFLGAQRVVVAGDSIRYRHWNAVAWETGRAAQVTSDSIWVRTGLGQLAVPVTAVQRLDRWERRNLGREVGWAALACSVTMTVLYLATPQRDRFGPWLTYDLIGVASGAAVGAVGVAVKPGLWKSVIRR